KSAQVCDVHVGGLLKTVDPFVEVHRLMHPQRLVRPEGGKYGSGQPLGGDFFMVRKVVGWIIGRAESGDVEFAEDAAGGKFGAGQLFVRLAPDAGGALLIERLVDAEVTLQLEMA